MTNGVPESAGQGEMRTYDWLYVCAVFAVFAAALALRLSGIQHGEPFKLHVDEPNFVRRSLGMLVTFDLNPGWFGHPGTFTMDCLAALYAVDAWLRGAPLSSLLDEYARAPERFHVLGKYLMVFWSLLGHVALWLLGQRFVTRWWSLLAVLFLATMPLDVEIAALIRTDTQRPCSSGCVSSCCARRTAKDGGGSSWQAACWGWPSP